MCSRELLPASKKSTLAPSPGLHRAIKAFPTHCLQSTENQTPWDCLEEHYATCVTRVQHSQRGLHSHVTQQYHFQIYQKQTKFPSKASARNPKLMLNSVAQAEIDLR